MTGDAMTLSAALGAQVRKLRTEAGVRQDDVAAAARAVGLDWSRSVVAAFERGGRQLAGEELLLLPLLLRRAGVSDDVELAGLLEAAGAVRLPTGATVPGRRLARIARGDAGWSVRVRLSPGARDALDRIGRLEDARHAIRVAERLLPDTPLVQLERIARDGGEAEQRAARRFGTSTETVSLVAHHLWGRSLTAERDAQLGTTASRQDPDHRGRRAWISRQLLADLEAAVLDAIAHDQET